MTMRKSTKCEKLLEANTENFYKSVGGKFGLHSACISCHLQRKINDYESNAKTHKYSDVLQIKEGESYVCNLCEYTTCDDSDMGKHLNTENHKKKMEK